MTVTKNPFVSILEKKNQVLWLCLAFHAGYLNAGGFLASHRFVSHMTGFGTSIGMNLSDKEFWIALEMILAPISFFVGAAYAGFLVDRKIAVDGEPRLLRGVGTIIALNLVVFVAGLNGVFGEFGEPLLLQRDFLLLFILCFVCGLQNGLFVSLTSGQIRTTHITGLVTDLGLNAVRTVFISHAETKKTEVRKNFLRLKTVLSFSIGSLLSAIIFREIEYWGFLGSTFISVCVVGLIIHIKSVHKDPGHVGVKPRV